jgi:hypothetical protein
MVTRITFYWIMIALTAITVAGAITMTKATSHSTSLFWGWAAVSAFALGFTAIVYSQEVVQISTTRDRIRFWLQKPGTGILRTITPGDYYILPLFVVEPAD